MKICIPTADDRGADSLTFDHFGSAPFFTVVDTEGDGLEVVDNSGGHRGQHSCGPVDLLKRLDIDAVVCAGMGRRALDRLGEAGIEVLAPASGTVSEVIRAVRAGRIQRMSPAQTCAGHAHGQGAGGGYGHGHGGCGGHHGPGGGRP